VDVALSQALTDAAVQQEMGQVIAAVFTSAAVTSSSHESIRTFFDAPHKHPQYTAIITSNPDIYPALTSLLHQFTTLGTAKKSLHTSVDLLDAADILSEDLSACPDIGSLPALKELYARKLTRMSAFRHSDMLGTIQSECRNLNEDTDNSRVCTATTEAMNMLTIDTTMATSLNGNIDLTFTSDAAALVFIGQNPTLVTDEEIEARMLKVARKHLFCPENVRWDGVLGVIAKTVDILRRYSLLDIAPTLFQVNDSFDHSTAILGGRYFPPVAIEAIDYSFHGTAETQLGACLTSVGAFIRENKRELIQRQGPTFLRFPRDIACFDGCSVVPPASISESDATFKVVLSLRVYKDATQAASRPHATVSHEAAISTWRAAETAVAGFQDVHVEVAGAYEWKRYSYDRIDDMMPALAALNNLQSCSDITSCPVDTVTMNTFNATQRLRATVGKVFGYRDYCLLERQMEYTLKRNLKMYLEG
jgi:hypothetical protein